MAQKEYTDPSIGRFVVTKRRNARKMTLRIGRGGLPNVTIPSALPFFAGAQFAQTQKNWIKEHAKPQLTLDFGETYTLYDDTRIEIVRADNRNSTSTLASSVQLALLDTEEDGQRYFMRAINKILSTDTKNVVESRIGRQATSMGQAPAAVKYKATVSRWGSCNQAGVLTFSVYLAQLPNELIDYVIIHELAHLRFMNHGESFWSFVGEFCPQYKDHKKALKDYSLSPILKRDGTEGHSLA